jgi:hypothetical protein
VIHNTFITIIKRIKIAPCVWILWIGGSYTPQPTYLAHIILSRINSTQYQAILLTGSERHSSQIKYNISKIGL